MDNLYMDVNKEPTAKDMREYELIVNNLELLKVLMRVFRGQALLLDFKEFCLKFRICFNEDNFDYIIEKLINNKILKKKVLAGTTNTVLVARTCVNRILMNENDSIDYSYNQIKLNCFKNALIVKNFIREDESLDTFIDRVNEQSTFLYTKNDVDKAYAFFSSKLDINEIGESSFKCAKYRKTKGLKKVNTIGSEKDEMKGYTNSFDTFVNKFIYTLYKDNRFTFYILDLDNNVTSSRVAKCVGMVVGTLYEQVQQVDLYSKLEEIEFIVITKDSSRADKIWSSFRNIYYKETLVQGVGIKRIKAYQEFLLESTQRALSRRVNNIRVRFSDVNKDSESVITFKNNNNEYGMNTTVRILNADLNSRLNVDDKVTRQKQNAQIRYENSIKAKYRKEMEEEIANIKAIYSATEEEIRAEIKKEYGIFGDFSDLDKQGELEEQEELELAEFYERNNFED